MLMSLKGAIALRNEWAGNGDCVGLTNGVFDVIHPGHIALIRAASVRCHKVIVAINSDASAKRLKGHHRPRHSEKERAFVLGWLRGVAAVVIFDEDTPLNTITALRPNVLIKGGDYAEADIVGAEFVKSIGGKIVIVPHSGHSTTRLLKQ